MMIVASRFTNEISSREWREYFLNENLQKKKKKTWNVGAKHMGALIFESLLPIHHYKSIEA